MAVEGGCIGMQTTLKPVDPVAGVQRSSEEREEEPEEEAEEDSEFIDEECDESGERRLRTGCTTGRVVTLQMLLAADILQPGEATMSIEYLGQRFMGDLLPDGKIKSVETDIVFASPSAWAIHCKRIINPEKKSGCGWASRARHADKRTFPLSEEVNGKPPHSSFYLVKPLEVQTSLSAVDLNNNVRYKGKKLEIYKTKYFKKRSLDQNKENEVTDDEEMELKTVPVQVPSPNPVRRMVIKHNILGNRSSLHDGNTLVESTPFSSMGKIQPFLVSLATNAALVMDFHCHLTTSEVVGYLAGHWDVNAHNLAVTHAFPCRSRLSDRESAPMVEAEICKGLEQRRLTLVGWYHSHPYAPATPTLRDIDSQLEYQIRMKGSSDASYTPCIGIICSPYNKESISISLESVMISYWVMPPPENKPHEYGKPMLMSYTVVQDNYLSQDALTEMKRCADFYKVEQDYVNFSEKYKSGFTHLDKLKNTLSSKFPRDQSNGGTLWNYLSELIVPGSTGETQPPPTQNNIPPTLPAPTTPLLLPTSLPITIPSTNKPTTLLGAELASALFASGKFPSPASLMSLSAIFPSTPSSSSSAPISILKPLMSTPSSHVTLSHSLSHHPLHSHNSTVHGSSHSHSLTSHGLQLHTTQSHSHVASQASHGIQTHSHSHPIGTSSHSSQTHTPTSHTAQSLLSLSLLPQSLPQISHTTQTSSLSSLVSSLQSLTQSTHTSQAGSQTSHTSQTIPQPLIIPQSVVSQPTQTTPTVTQPPQTPTSASQTSQSLPPPANPPQTRPPPTPPPQTPSPAKIPKLDETHVNNVDKGCPVTSSQTP